MTLILPELSIIVPFLGDSAELSGLLANLAGQSGIQFELLLCDGGFSDTPEELTDPGISFPVRMIRSLPGRGIQMNAGASEARADVLLFLHSDSRFLKPDALHLGLQAFRSHVTAGGHAVAARFALLFRRADTSPSLAYFYHEAKARLNRGDCIRGDQGFMLERRYFEKLGRFETSLHYLEDVRLAILADKQGSWLLLPAEISTSARRFEKEGFLERQIVNMIIINAVATDWDELLQSMPELYRCNSVSGRLLLAPILTGIHRLIASHDASWRQTFWKNTGRHLAGNTWQLFFWLDVRQAFRSGKTPDEVNSMCLTFYRQRLQKLFESKPAGWLAEIIARVWFRWMLKRTTD